MPVTLLIQLYDTDILFDVTQFCFIILNHINISMNNDNFKEINVQITSFKFIKRELVITRNFKEIIIKKIYTENTHSGKTGSTKSEITLPRTFLYQCQRSYQDVNKFIMLLSNKVEHEESTTSTLLFKLSCINLYT